MARTKTVESLEARITTLVNADFAASSTRGEAKTAAFALLNGITTLAALVPVRDAVKAAYTTRYLLEIGQDKDKAKAACDMFWSRTVKAANELGFVRPMDMSAEAVAARAKREAKKVASGKPDGRTTKTGSNKSNKGKVDVIVPESDDDDLQDAFDYVMETPEHQVAFKLWYAKQISATRTIHRAA